MLHKLMTPTLKIFEKKSYVLSFSGFPKTNMYVWLESVLCVTSCIYLKGIEPFSGADFDKCGGVTGFCRRAPLVDQIRRYWVGSSVVSCRVHCTPKQLQAQLSQSDVQAFFNPTKTILEEGSAPGLGGCAMNQSDIAIEIAVSQSQIKLAKLRDAIAISNLKLSTH